jgi:hypothetical protein
MRCVVFVDPFVLVLAEYPWGARAHWHHGVSGKMWEARVGVA